MHHNPSQVLESNHFCMKDATNMIQSGILNIDNFWTKGYDRETEWQQAFEDGNSRPMKVIQEVILSGRSKTNN